ncbi:ABC transporter permease [Peribacillus loiseleuriae]|uniref:Nitrate ABC transporter permease n=1 Tax=Peribacillus loiseleuriae TaxID=1679170 RepID=A0A0K9GZK2_9BACI|nr:ABC transporter permease [Peribacillus loiseleuriae]KMY52164.1 nitrate ABC transporter permease [Peribacillus loiseleuriae]
MKIWYKGWRPALVLILLFIIWEVSCRLFEIPKWLLPSPTQILLEGAAGWPNYYRHLTSTIGLAIIGFLIGSSVGIAVAIGLHLIPKLREALYPIIILSQNIPIIVLAPLLVIWFGFGILPKLIVITLVCFFPITVAALDGFRQTSSELMHYMKMAGALKKQIFWKLEWPYALPSIFSGLKISATYSVMGAVISEWLGAKEGIGVYMTLASSSFRTDRVFVAIFLIMVLSLVFFALIVSLERMIVKWKPKGDGKGRD